MRIKPPAREAEDVMRPGLFVKSGPMKYRYSDRIGVPGWIPLG